MVVSEGGDYVLNLKQRNYMSKSTKTKKAETKKRMKQLVKIRNQYSGGDPFHRSDAWLALRYKALTVYGRKCMCCGASSLNTIFHVDHIKPRSLYPLLALEFSNLQVLCEPCNIGKGNRDMTDFRKKSTNRFEKPDYIEL